MSIIGNALNSIKNDAQNALDILKRSANGTSAQSVASASDGDDPSGNVQKLQSLATDSQSFTSLMARGLRVDNFTSGGGATDWDKNYPYRFVVLQKTIGPVLNPESDDENYQVVASFRLPINPQELAVSTPFATKVTVTSNGILEEHNGTPLKQITINGTTGILINRSSKNSVNPAPGVLGTLFGGTLQATGSFISSFSSALSSFSNLSAATGRTEASNLNDTAFKTSGYYQYHMMRMFLESYAELKNSPGGQKYRLAFQMAKRKQTYMVAVNNLQDRQSVSSPMEIMYTITMTAWASLNNDFTLIKPKVNTLGPIQRDLGTTRRLFNALNNLRNVTSKFNNIISNAKADVETNIYGPMNNVILLAKDVLSIPKTVADFPKSLRDSFMTSVAANWQSLARDNENLKKLIGSKLDDLNNQRYASFIQDGSNSISATPFEKNNNNGIQDVFDPASLDDITVTDTIQLNSIPLSNQQQLAIDEFTEQANNTNANDINALIDQLEQLSDKLLSDITGKLATDEEWGILYAIHDTIGELLASLADGSFNLSVNRQAQADTSAQRATDALSFWQAFSQSNEIGYTKPQGKVSIPFPFRSTLQELAAIYLNDATRWMEIASLNGLQYPYIDEDGFTYNFLGNGSQNAFNINTKENLYVGQTIFLSSTLQVSNKRKIVAINEISSTNYQIVVDGPATLNLFTVAQSAKMKAYLPYTVNSMMEIFLPIDVPPESANVETKPITYIKDDPEMVKFSKIDLLLTPDYDLAVTSDGFVNLAFGKTNLLQAAKLKLATVAGSDILNPGFGAGVEIGQSPAELDINSIIGQINSSFANDPRFNSPSSISFELNGNSLVMNIIASIRRGNGVLPISIPLSR